MLSPAVNTVASGYASSSSAVASSLVRSQRAMLPAPMSWTARGEAVTAATGAGGARGVAGGGDVADGIWSSLHVASSSRATGRATATSLARRDVIVPSAVVGRSHQERPAPLRGAGPVLARHGLELQGRCHRTKTTTLLPHAHLRPARGPYRPGDVCARRAKLLPG